MGTEQKICSLVAEIIREQSQEAVLISAEEIQAKLEEKRAEEEERQAEERQAEEGQEPVDWVVENVGDAIEAALESNEDLRVIHSQTGTPLYHSTQHLTASYAQILIRKETPLLQIVETVRENSQRYPQPIPLDMFEDTPFDLAPQEIQDCLKIIGGKSEYQDIAFTTTSVNTIYLYSTQYLEHDYAEMLAERFDVGLDENP